MRNGRYARHLQATRKKTAQPVEPVREWVERLYALFDESGVGETVDPTSVWTARECYEFLACQGGAVASAPRGRGRRSGPRTSHEGLTPCTDPVRAVWAANRRLRFDSSQHPGVAKMCRSGGRTC